MADENTDRLLGKLEYAVKSSNDTIRALIQSLERDRVEHKDFRKSMYDRLNAMHDRLTKAEYAGDAIEVQEVAIAALEKGFNTLDAERRAAQTRAEVNAKWLKFLTGALSILAGDHFTGIISKVFVAIFGGRK